MTLKILIIIVLLLVLLYNLYPIEFTTLFVKIYNDIILTVTSKDTNKGKTEQFETGITDPNSTNSPNINTVNTSITDNSKDEDNDMNIPYRYKNATYGNNYFIPDGGNGTLGLTSNLCSKSCCFPQYPLPFEMPVDPLLCNSEEEFVPSSYTCNNGIQDTGCLCMTKEQSQFLGRRGGNT